jgi:FkbM family methyltransferase
MISGILQSVKNALVRRGPDSQLVQLALTAHAKARGFTISREGDAFHLRRDTREMVLSKMHYVQVPIMEDCFDLFFETIKARDLNGRRVLDFSGPGLHEYVKSGQAFLFPSIPEDDVMDVYTRQYNPKAGDVVWDVGAHAGATTFFLSQLVGPAGRVYAFEPDEKNFFYLLKNIDRHQLANVVAVKKALSGNTGSAMFSMDGTMSAGITEFMIYAGDASTRSKVETITMEDACEEFGSIPRYVKMDIEGAEVAVINASVEFLRAHSIHFAVESHRLEDGNFTHMLMSQPFKDSGYVVESSNHRGQVFAWAYKG